MIKHMKIGFNVNQRKSLEAVLYIAGKAGGEINIYSLLKAIFEADKIHLNKFARPVTGDAYIKMAYGTVPSTIYDFIKQNPLALGSLNLEKYPFEITGHNLKSSRPFDDKYFSKSDLKALDEGFSVYGKLDFNEVKERNHKERCWIETELNAAIPFEKMIDNEDVLNELQETEPFSIVV